MKYIRIKFFVIIFLLIGTSRFLAQGIPAEGTPELLFVFVETEDSKGFSYSIDDMVNEIITFYSTMSLKQFTPLIRTISINLEDADQFINYKEANHFILDQINEVVDFSFYSSHRDTNIIDGVFIIYNKFYDDWTENPSWSGYAHIGLDFYDRAFDEKFISKKDAAGFSSGAVIKTPHGYWHSFWVIVHEIGHVLGLTHFPLERQNPYTQLMNPQGEYWNINRSMSFWEREKLGWIEPETFIDLSRNDYIDKVIINLSDFISYGEVAKIKLPYSEDVFGFSRTIQSYPEYSIENHMMINKYDQIGSANDRGFLIWPSKGFLALADGIADYENPPFSDSFNAERSNYTFVYKFRRVNNLIKNKEYFIQTFEKPISIDIISDDQISIEFGQTLLLNEEKILKEVEPIEEEFTLFDNYPNPFNGSTKIKFSLKTQGTVKINIYNSIGEFVNEFFDHTIKAGNYSLNFNASEFSAGVYFYTVESKTKNFQYSLIKKMIYLK